MWVSVNIKAIQNGFVMDLTDSRTLDALRQSNAPVDLAKNEVYYRDGKALTEALAEYLTEALKK